MPNSAHRPPCTTLRPKWMLRRAASPVGRPRCGSTANAAATSTGSRAYAVDCIMTIWWVVVFERVSAPVTVSRDATLIEPGRGSLRTSLRLRDHRLMKHPLVTLALLVFVPVAIAAPPRAIPGINAKDAFPAGCVGCHVKDHRISTTLAQHWNGKVDAKTLAAMQAFVPKGITLKGKHPTVATKDIPASCLKCHTATSKGIPPPQR